MRGGALLVAQPLGQGHLQRAQHAVLGLGDRGRGGGRDAPRQRARLRHQLARRHHARGQARALRLLRRQPARALEVKLGIRVCACGQARTLRLLRMSACACGVSGVGVRLTRPYTTIYIMR